MGSIIAGIASAIAAPVASTLGAAGLGATIGGASLAGTIAGGVGALGTAALLGSAAYGVYSAVDNLSGGGSDNDSSIYNNGALGSSEGASETSTAAVTDSTSSDNDDGVTNAENVGGLGSSGSGESAGVSTATRGVLAAQGENTFGSGGFGFTKTLGA